MDFLSVEIGMGGSKIKRAIGRAAILASISVSNGQWQFVHGQLIH